MLCLQHNRILWTCRALSNVAALLRQPRRGTCPFLFLKRGKRLCVFSSLCLRGGACEPGLAPRRPLRLWAGFRFRLHRSSWRSFFTTVVPAAEFVSGFLSYCFCFLLSSSGNSIFLDPYFCTLKCLLCLFFPNLFTKPRCACYVNPSVCHSAHLFSTMFNYTIWVNFLSL